MITFEEIVARCRELRLTFEQDEAKFLLFLVEVETKYMAQLRGNGCPTFSVFLDQFSLCDVKRYSQFHRGLLLLNGNTKKAESIGSQAVIALCDLRDATKVDEYVDAAKAFTVKHSVHASLQTARKMLRQVDPRPEQPDSMKYLDDLARARAENVKLRADLASAQRKIRDLKRKLDTAEKAAAKAKKKADDLQAKLNVATKTKKRTHIPVEVRPH